jgi:betaine-aldehyde dehydrogenase
MLTQPVASHFINGEYVEDTGGTPIDVIYPATGQCIARVYGATDAVIEQDH